MESSISPNGSPSKNGSSDLTQETIERAASSANPALWLQAFAFYMSHSSDLSLTEDEAMQWADRDVAINTEAREEFGLPPAQPSGKQERHVA